MLNKVTLIGNVGKIPDIRQIELNQVANFTLATTERGFKTKDGREIPDRTEWHNIVIWGGLAKVVESFVHKGSQICIEGKIKTRNYDDKDGVKRYITEIYADNLILLGGKRDESKPQEVKNEPAPVQPSPAEEFQDQLPF